MKSLQRFAYILSLGLLAAALPGCFITTQSFNHGKLLNPGERIITHGFGWRYASRSRPYTEGYDSASYLSYRSVRDSTRFGWGTYTLDYRVGILRTRPFGKGLETGFHLEAAFGAPQRQIINYTCDYSGNHPADSPFDLTTRPRIVSADTQVVDKAEFYGPPTLEVDTRFGLSDIVMRKCIMHHNVSAGWTIYSLLFGAYFSRSDRCAQSLHWQFRFFYHPRPEMGRTTDRWHFVQAAVQFLDSAGVHHPRGFFYVSELRDRTADWLQCLDRYSLDDGAVK